MAESMFFDISMLRRLLPRMASMSTLMWLNSKSDTKPEKKSNATMLRNPIVTRLRIPVI